MSSVRPIHSSKTNRNGKNGGERIGGGGVSLRRWSVLNINAAADTYSLARSDCGDCGRFALAEREEERKEREKYRQWLLGQMSLFLPRCVDGWINPMSSHAVVVALAILSAAMLQVRFHTYLARRGQHDGGGRDADEF